MLGFLAVTTSPKAPPDASDSDASAGLLSGMLRSRKQFLEFVKEDDATRQFADYPEHFVGTPFEHVETKTEEHRRRHGDDRPAQTPRRVVLPRMSSSFREVHRAFRTAFPVPAGQQDHRVSGRAPFRQELRSVWRRENHRSSVSASSRQFPRRQDAPVPMPVAGDRTRRKQRLGRLCNEAIGVAGASPGVGISARR